MNDNFKKNVFFLLNILAFSFFIFSSTFLIKAEADVVLNVVCSANPSSTEINSPVIWTANATGGDGDYIYEWFGTDSLSGNTRSVTKTYNISGLKIATVSVISEGVIYQEELANCSVLVNPDTIAPTMPTISTTSATGTIITSATVSWNNSSDTGSGISHYLYSWTTASTTQILSSTTPGVFSTTATSTSVSIPGTWWFSIASVDNAGNISTTTNVGPFLISDSQVLIINSTIAGVYYDFYSPIIFESILASTTGNTTIVDSTIASTSINNSDLDTVDASADSVIDESSLVRCLVVNSTVIDFIGSDCSIVDSYIQSSTSENGNATSTTIINSTFDNSNLIDSYIATSTIINSDLTNSTSTNSYIATSTIVNSVITNSTSTDSTITDSTITDSTIASSTVDNSTIIDSTVVNSIISSSTLDTVIVSSSTITNTDINNAIIIDATIIDGIIENGIITVNGTTTVISTSTPIQTLLAVLTSLDISPLNPSIALGVVENITFTATILDQYGEDFNTTVIWSVGNPLVGSIDQSGVFTPLSLGTSTVIATAGHLALATIITVNELPDTEAPVITISGSNPANVVVGTPYIDAGATALDARDGDLTAYIVVNNPVNLSSSVGTYEVTYSVSDFSGNGATSTRTVNVIALPDTVEPTITILGDNPVNINVGTTYVDAGATALDNIDGDITANIVVTGLPVDTSIAGTHIVTYTVTDSSTNSTSTSRTVNVIDIPTDTIAPTITITGGSPVTVYLNSVYVDQGATAIDAVDGVVEVIELSNNVDTSATGTYQVIYSAIDSSMNIATNTREVIVIDIPADNISPVITIIGGTPITVVASSTYTELGAIAIDDVDGDLTANIVITGTVDSDTIGQYAITYTVSDSAMNTSSAIRDVFVVEATTTDNILPVIFITGGTPISIVQGETYIELGATATDDIDGDLTANIVITGSVDTNTVGTYIITYTVSDSASNTSVAYRTVNVVSAGPDITPPAITVIDGSPITIAQNSVYTDPGATAMDDRDGDITANIVVTGLPIDTSATGTYTITYTVSDSAMNTSSASRQVIVVEDTTAPVITILGANPIDIVQNLTYTDAGAIAIDNIEGDVTANIVVTGLPVNTSATGTYEIIYTVSDSTGNTASSTRIVNVIPDNIAPVITILGANPVNLTVGDSYTDAGATAIDNVDGLVIVVVVSNNVDTSVVGTYSVVYNATDTAENLATATRVVNVNPVDSIPPVITILGSNPITVVMGDSYTDAGATANDDVDGSVTADIIVTGLPLNTSATGTYMVTYTVSDRASNTAIATRVVNIVEFADITPPVITILGANPVTLTVGATYVDQGATAFDNVDGDITSHIATVNNVNTAIVGSYSVRYIVTDGAMNTASSTRIVIVNAVDDTDDTENEEEVEEVVTSRRRISGFRRIVPVVSPATTTATSTETVSTTTPDISDSTEDEYIINNGLIIATPEFDTDGDQDDSLETDMEGDNDIDTEDNERSILSGLTASVADGFASFGDFFRDNPLLKYYSVLLVIVSGLGSAYYFFIFKKK